MEKAWRFIWDRFFDRRTYLFYDYLVGGPDRPDDATWHLPPPELIRRDFGSACTETENGALLLQMASPDEKSAVMKRLVEQYDVDEIKVFEPSLNDIFVQYAGEQV